MNHSVFIPWTQLLAYTRQDVSSKTCTVLINNFILWSPHPQQAHLRPQKFLKQWV